MNWHSLKEEQVFRQLLSKKEGLSQEEITRRIQKYGKNELRKIRKLNALKILFSQFYSFLIIILIIAAVISALLGHWIDFGVIIAIVLLNSSFGFIQEYKAEKAIEKLKQILVPQAKVLRDNKVMKIDARKIVPGDILILSSGDKIMADARIFQCENLQTNEAALTGESVPEEKQPLILKIDTPLGDRINMLYQGTQVVKGNCKALVVSTGMKTEFGKIATLVQKVKQERNPLRKKIDVFARNLGLIAIGLIVLITLFGLWFGFDKFQIFLIAISLAVSAIPEGLPAVITITLALATRRMLNVKSLIRKLPAAETLGRATFICTDKTGTITEEKMQVKSLYVNNKIQPRILKDKETELLLKIGILCNDARFEKEKDGKGKIIGDPTEAALILSAKEYGLNKKEETEKNPKIKEFPFTSERKMMSIVRKVKKTGSYLNYVKGAPEVILNRCKGELINNKIKAMNQKRQGELIASYEQMASQGLRVLGFAYKTITRTGKEINQEKAERALIFVGFQGMIDPPRPEVKQALKECKGAGINVLMITGDSILTARAVGREIGLIGKAITSSQLEKMSDAELSKEVYNISIFARVSPEDKLRIVKILKTNKEIVAVTGDGVNDAPALKKADIGIAVGRGTDVAKDASDIVLLDNNFASIVKAVKEGRRVYDNIKKFIKYMLSANLDEIMLVMISIFFGLPLALLPLQILWLNFVTSFPALGLSTEYAEEDVMKRKPNKKGVLKGTLKFILIAGLLAFVVSFLAFYMTIQDVDKARTMAATTAMMFEMFLVFNCKTQGSVFKSKFNKYIIYGIIGSVVPYLIVLYTPINKVFQFVPLGGFDWLKIIGMCAVAFIIIEVVKKKLN